MASATSPPSTRNLPSPPPPDRLPPPKGRPRQKFKILGKQKDRGRRDVEPELDDGWTLEGNTETHVQEHAGDSVERNSMDVRRAIDQDRDTQVYEIAIKEEEKKEKRSKGRQLVKKTSRLFGRDKDKSESNSANTNGSSAILPLRQISSVSGEAQATASRHLPSAFLNRQTSLQTKSRPSRDSFSQQRYPRRTSHDSQVSWQASRSILSYTSQDTMVESSPTNGLGLPIPQRQGASIPTLSRLSLPQPAGSSNSLRSPETFPAKMSTWFSHLLSTTESSAGLSETIISPIRKQPSVASSLFNAARQKAVEGVRHLLDSEATPDKCMETIWVRGVDHLGWRPVTPENGPLALPVEYPENRRSSVSSNRPSPTVFRPSSWRRSNAPHPAHVFPPQPNSPAAGSCPNTSITNLFNGSALSLALPGGSPSMDREKYDGGDSPSKKKGKEAVRWPEQFYDDFKSTIWCTYRTQYAPILNLSPNLLIPTPEAYYASFGPPLDATVLQPLALQQQASSPTQTTPVTTTYSTGWWNREERGLTSDAGWGCMLRTGQSLLVNALIHVHLGRNWRLPATYPPNPPTSISEVEATKAYAKYTQILSWFFDDPSPLCPFSVHRMALIGKELGKEVGEWFGPSTAAGALKTLANSFAPSGVSVATATDSIIYKSDVYAASRISSESWRQAHPCFAPFEGDKDVAYGGKELRADGSGDKWGERAVLVLVGVRLGLDEVNPIYYDSIKALFTFPQSVGIAGGRPSSSYYFIGTQANSLFYLDPHTTRPAIPLQIPPLPSYPTVICTSTSEESDSSSRGSLDKTTFDSASTSTDEGVMIPSSKTPSTPSSTFTQPAPSQEAEVVQYKLDVVDMDDVSEDSDEDGVHIDRFVSTDEHTPGRGGRMVKKSPSSEKMDYESPTQRSPETIPAVANSTPTLPSHTSVDPINIQIDPYTLWYATAYSPSSLRTFHCEKVKKMPYSSLDPSMLLGFICRGESDFVDFVERIGKLPNKIFTVQDEQPVWAEDDDVGLESVSEPDFDEDDEGEAGEGEPRAI
ncbi:hypothetical protein L204_106164 [Cryptococcus depauperatus]